MLLVRATWLFLANLFWRLTSREGPGRVLIRALGSRDENIRTIAGMLLVRGGAKSAPLLREALSKRESLPLILPIVASIGDPQFEPLLRQLTEDTDPSVAKCARDALRLIRGTQAPA
jgi:hypothetical protein